MRADWRHVVQDATRRMQALAGDVRARLMRRPEAIVSAALLCLGFHLFANVSLTTALAGFAAALVLATFWPLPSAANDAAS